MGNSMQLLTIDQASQLLGISHLTIRRWCYKKRLNHVRIGKRLLIRKSDIEDMIQKCFVEATEKNLNFKWKILYERN